MHQLLQKLFEKRGISGITDLSNEEKEDFERSRLILAKEELTINDVKEFCKFQLDVIKGRWQDYNIDQKKKSELIPYFTVYNSLLTAIDSPKAVREMEEKRLKSILEQ